MANFMTDQIDAFTFENLIDISNEVKAICRNCNKDTKHKSTDLFLKTDDQFANESPCTCEIVENVLKIIGELRSELNL